MVVARRAHQSSKLPRTLHSSHLYLHTEESTALHCTILFSSNYRTIIEKSEVCTVGPGRNGPCRPLCKWLSRIHRGFLNRSRGRARATSPTRTIAVTTPSQIRINSPLPPPLRNPSPFTPPKRPCVLSLLAIKTDRYSRAINWIVEKKVIDH